MNVKSPSDDDSYDEEEKISENGDENFLVAKWTSNNEARN